MFGIVDYQVILYYFTKRKYVRIDYILVATIKHFKNSKS